MATSIPPHNLGEIIDATIALINNKEITIGQLNEACSRTRFSYRWFDNW